MHALGWSFSNFRNISMKIMSCFYFLFEKLFFKFYKYIIEILFNHINFCVLV